MSSQNESLLICLIHSPLVGPITWEPVADTLRRLNYPVIVPTITDETPVEDPYWKQHAESAARVIRQAASGRPVVLAGHSGAGPLLPAIRQALEFPVAAYLFVDAGLPVHGANRLQMMEAEDIQWAAEFRRYLEGGGTFPAWSDEDLAPVVPDPGLRRALLEQLQPRGLDFFLEPIPVFPGWPDAPCAYLHFSPPYIYHAAQARRLRWPVLRVEAGHFHMLVDPIAVASAMLELYAKATEIPDPPIS